MVAKEGRSMNRDAEQHLARAREYVGKGEEFYRRAADEIIAAQKADPALSNREVGEWFGRSGDWVRLLVRQATNGEDLTTPFGGDTDFNRASRWSAAKKVLREAPPEQAAKLVVEAPPATRRAIARALAKADARDASEATERRVREHGEDWHNYTSEALRTLADARRLAKQAHEAVMAAGRTGQLTDERRELLTASAGWTSLAFEYVKEAAAGGHAMDAALDELLTKEA